MVPGRTRIHVVGAAAAAAAAATGGCLNLLPVPRSSFSFLFLPCRL
jgi:hypothetical protein